MKIKTNFSAIPDTPVMFISSLIWTITLLIVIGCAGLVASAHGLNQDIEEMRDVKLRLDKRLSVTGKRKNTSILTTAEFEAFKKEVTALSRLDKNQGINPSLVMAKLERLLPNSVYLLSLQYQRETGNVSLTAESSRTAPLALFLRRIELDTNFNKVLLLRQLQEGQGNKKRIRYSIKFISRQL